MLQFVFIEEKTLAKSNCTILEIVWYNHNSLLNVSINTGKYYKPTNLDNLVTLGIQSICNLLLLKQCIAVYRTQHQQKYCDFLAWM